MAYALDRQDRQQYRRQIITASGIDLGVGLWLALAPFILGYAEWWATWNSVIVGAAVALLAGTRVFGAHRAAVLSWINVVFGIWLIVSPWPLGGLEEGAVFWNNVMSGIVIATCASWSALSTPPPEI